MSILIIKSGTTSISGGTVKGDFTYFSATTKGLGETIDTGFWSGVDPTCDGYTVYKIGGQHGWAAMVATGRDQLNYYLKLFGGTGSTTDENVTWAANSNNIFLHSGSTGPCPTLTPTPTLEVCSSTLINAGLPATCSPYNPSGAYTNTVYLGGTSGVVSYDFYFPTFSLGSSVTIQAYYNETLIGTSDVYTSPSSENYSFNVNYNPTISGVFSIKYVFLNCHDFTSGSNLTTIMGTVYCPNLAPTPTPTSTSTPTPTLTQTPTPTLTQESIIYDLYIADKYDCTTEVAVDTVTVALPTGTVPNYTKFYNSDIDLGIYAYKLTSTTTTGPGLILNTTQYDTLLLACPL